MLYLIGIGIVFPVMGINGIPFPITQIPMISSTEVDFPFRALEGFVHPISCAGEVSAFTVNHRAIFVGECDYMMVKDLSMVFTCTNLTPTCTFRFHRIALLDPIGHIDVVHVLLSDMISAKAS